MEKTMKARVQHKHDIEANWLKTTNFTPLASEIIVYDSDENYDYPRIKIGDGKTNINNLPFIVDEAKIAEIISNSLEEAKNSGEFDGKDGQDGTNASLSIKYTRSTSNSTEPTTWQDSIPTLTPTEKYLWAQFTKIEGLSSSVWTGVVGAYGDKGDKGDQGIQGEIGQTGERGAAIYFINYDCVSSYDTLPIDYFILPEGVFPVVGDLALCKNGKLGIILKINENNMITIQVKADLMGASGPRGQKGDKGDTGATGGKGADGVSVSSVNQTSTSSADGGSNVVTVTLSNGTTSTFTVKNGSKGSAGTNGKDGKTPVKGTDYFTEADQESIVQQVIAALGTPVFGRVDVDKNIILTGELANGTYTIKYEDADGNVTEIGTLNHTVVPEPTYTNLLPLAINSDGTPYNGGKGWKTGYRLNSSGTETAQDGIEVVGFIPATRSDIVYFANIDWPYDHADAQYSYIVLYDSSFAKLYATKFGTIGGRNDGVTYDSNKNAISINISTFADYYGVTANVSYIRISALSITKDSIITKNEPIE